MDIRYSLRTLWKNPAFAFIAILVLALGIGATTAIFSVVNAVLIRPLPYQDPARLVAFSSVYQRDGVSRRSPTVSLNEVEQWRAESRSFDSIGSFVFSALPVSVGTQSLFLVALGADPEFLETLGIRPEIGRNLAGSGSKAKDPSVVISHRLWVRAFHSDPQAIGRSITLDGSLGVVAGVLPATFQFPRTDASYFAEDPDIVYAVSNIADSWGRDSSQWFAIGRLKPGVTMAQANADLKAIMAGMRGTSADVAALDKETAQRVRPALLLTLGISCVLLLIACTNIMNLLFSRGAQRGRELAIRRAVGATGGRLVRQMLTESACLTFLAGTVGIALAALTLDTLVALSPAHLPISGRVGIDWTVLGFAFLICTAASVIAGVLPAIHQGSAKGVTLISSGTRTSGNRALLGFQSSLMVAQIALGMGLMAAAGLLAHSLLRLNAVDPGFRTADTVAFEVAFPSGRPAETARLYQAILDATRSVPGVVSAGWITNPPPETRAGFFMPLSVAGAPSGGGGYANFQVTSEDYFQTAGIALTRGRDFSSTDASGRPSVAIVNEALARQYFPNADPLGRHVMSGFDGRDEREVVGVIRDIHDRGLSAKPVPTLYVPYHQFALGYGGVVARTAANSGQILPEIRRRIAQADPTIALTHLTTIQARLAKTLDAPRFYTVIAGACALMAVLFVSLGLYGVISYAVSRRTAEIGIRMALGAPREEILRGVVGHGLRLAAIGVAIGAGLSLAGTRMLRTLLFEIKPIDPLTLGIAAVLVVAVTLGASYLPARRASLVDPMVALRHE